MKRRFICRREERFLQRGERNVKVFGVDDALQASFAHSQMRGERASGARVNGALSVSLYLLICEMFLNHRFLKIVPDLLTISTVLNRASILFITINIFLYRLHAPRETFARGLA